MRARMPALAVLPLILMLSACGGDDYGDIPATDARAGGAAEGRAVKGVLQGADVLLQVPAGDALADYALTRTDDSGAFRFDSLPAGPFKVTLSAPADDSGRMLCDALPDCGPSALHPLDTDGNGVFDFGESMPLPADFSLSAWYAQAPDSDILAVTPLTHLAATLAESYPGEVDADAVRIATATVASLFDLDEDFSSRWPAALTDDDISAVGGAQMHHALLSAGFASLATAGDMQAVLDEYAGALVALGGQLPLSDSAGDLEALILASVEMADSLLEEGATLAQTAAALQHLVQRWSGSHTMVATEAEVDAEDLARALVPLDDLDHYLNLANINGDGQFFADQVGQLDWLYQQATLDFAGTVIEAASQVILVAAMGDFIAAQYELTELDLSANGMTTLYNAETRVLTLNKAVDGDLVVISVNMDDLMAGATAGELSYSMDGLVANAEVGGTMEGSLAVDLYDTDIVPLIEVAQGLLLENPEISEQDLIDTLLVLVATFHGRATVTGEMALFKSSDPEFAFNVEGSAWAELNVPALNNGGDVLALEISYGTVTSPWGDSIYSLEEGVPALAVAVGEDGVLDARFGFEAFGMPAMEVSAAGRLDNVGTVIQQAVNGLDLSEGASGLLALAGALDYSVLDLYGSATLDIPVDGKRYVFDLNGLRLDVSLPNSVEQGLQFHLTSINGGYLYSGGSLVGTVTFDWANTGATVFLLDGTQRSYFLGPLDDILPAELAEVLAGIL